VKNVQYCRAHLHQRYVSRVDKVIM